MSVPPTSCITVARVRLPGLRFTVDITDAFSDGDKVLDRLARGGWRTAYTLVGPIEREVDWWLGRLRSEDMERHLLEALQEAGVPDRPGVFLEPEEAGSEGAPALPPLAAFAVLARRSGPLYLPSRRLEPSLVDPRRPLVLFFPEEEPR
jgi:hypothetical protein